MESNIQNSIYPGLWVFQPVLPNVFSVTQCYGHNTSQFIMTQFEVARKLKRDTVTLEYKLLRSEIEESIKNQARILGYGGAVLSLLVGLGVYQQSFILLVSLPFLAFFFFVLWNVEQTRMMRAGDYISFLEDRIAEEYVGEPVMLWESWLRYRSEHPERDIYELHYLAQYTVLGVFLVIIVIGMFGVWLWRPDTIDLWISLLLAPIYGLFLLVSLYFLNGAVQHHNMEDSLQAFLNDYRRELNRS